jgi:hypothetical protein
MKKAIFAAIGACLMALGLMACGGANAAQLNENFTANPANTVFSTQGADSVEKVVTGIAVTRSVLMVNADGTVAGFGKQVRAYPDPTGSVWDKFKTNASANGFVPTSSAKTKYLSAKNALDSNCINAPFSQFVYYAGAENINDGCVAYDAGKALGN